MFSIAASFLYIYLSSISPLSLSHLFIYLLPYLFIYAVLGIEPKACYMLENCSTTELLLLDIFASNKLNRTIWLQVSLL
jgi:hypothetical protein